MNATSPIFAVLTLGAALGCRPRDDKPLPKADNTTIEASLQDVDAFVVRDSQDHTIRTISDRDTMKAFVALLPTPEFEDIFDKAGPSQYSVEFRGGGRMNYRVWITATHVRYVPKGAARLAVGHRAALLHALGITP